MSEKKGSIHRAFVGRKKNEKRSNLPSVLIQPQKKKKRQDAGETKGNRQFQMPRKEKLT